MEKFKSVVKTLLGWLIPALIGAISASIGWIFGSVFFNHEEEQNETEATDEAACSCDCGDSDPGVDIVPEEPETPDEE